MGELHVMGTRVFEGIQKLLTAVLDNMRPALLETFQDFCSPPCGTRHFGQAYFFCIFHKLSYLSPKSNVFFFLFSVEGFGHDKK